ncbi:D-alanyl-D-alanine carboxypeptidase [Neolewinella antarctica]|uniref:D-alanyl-D-alanine carboxypeptidase/D-alanyl-D-alanine-endopeptidase (Penicillin-binding protein 4) n=1 Tax=Neolewinella antarctica TaxID=442734 RepID=A0ABX0XEZ1_9BACT|nr:D-alanyl-D-alanine carboxypeptidase [Neolewinella antarctica]NJC27449.1 D-alanyl-D-alanine carboxypeptidase/D-alanyl-D-alanine-endopeptidase (penicillin-binding protein 4) [Neolewinella antarctica]
MHSANHHLHFLLFLSLFLALSRVQGQGDGRAGLSTSEREKLSRLVDQNTVFEQGISGFSLYDVSTSARLYDYNADRLFVPASNVKLFTFYVANRVLGNRAPAVFYQNYLDHLELWGTGYPLTLHPQFLADDLLTPWLRQKGIAPNTNVLGTSGRAPLGETPKPIIIHYPTGQDQLPRYGAGWSWDDYNGGYVFERSTFPMFGNRLYVEQQESEVPGVPFVYSSPPNALSQITQDADQRPRTWRREFDNGFVVRPGYLPNSYPLQRSLTLSPVWMVSELNAALPGLNASPGYQPYPPRADLNTFEVTLPDTVYRRFLQNSDNYLAEQLLLLAAAQRYGVPDEERIIDYARDTLFPALGISDFRWVDGSGLSRYNLVTPRQLTRIVMALDQEVGRERLLDLLPSGGGDNGTLKRRFDGASEPYVWAKTGSLSGVACISGLVKTKRGRWLAFSFMHNNFVQSSLRYYIEMEKVLGWCYEEL